MRSRDEASKLLGEKMLQGWTMLGASCPVEDCYTPLMRNKQGKMFCVRCDQYVVTEEEAKKQAEQEAEEMAAAAAAEEAETEARYEEERRRRIEQQFRLEEQAKQAREMQELEKAKAQRATATLAPAAKRKIDNTVSLSGAENDAEINAIRRQTLAALYQNIHYAMRGRFEARSNGRTSPIFDISKPTNLKLTMKMEALTDSLSPNDHSERLISVTKAVREIAEAAQLLK